MTEIRKSISLTELGEDIASVNQPNGWDVTHIERLGFREIPSMRQIEDPFKARTVPL